VKLCHGNDKPVLDIWRAMKLYWNETALRGLPSQKQAVTAKRSVCLRMAREEDATALDKLKIVWNQEEIDAATALSE